MRYLNRPLFRKIEDLRNGLYVKPQRHVDGEEVIRWVQRRLSEGSNLVSPMVGLLDRLTKSWGLTGKPGNVEEIFHITCLIRDHLEQIVQYEEQIYFVNVPEEYEKLIDLLKNLIGAQAAKLSEIPDFLDQAVSLIGTNHGGTIEDPRVIEETITFDVPKEWTKQMSHEIRRAKRHQLHQSGKTAKGGWLLFFIIAFIIWLLIKIF